jgi:hypothetical protein
MNRLSHDLPLLKGTLLVASTLTGVAGATIAPSLPTMQARFAEVVHVDLLVRWGRKLLLISFPLYGLTGNSPSSRAYQPTFAQTKVLPLLPVLVVEILVPENHLIGCWYPFQTQKIYFPITPFAS